MWEFEYAVETTADRDRLWGHWADVAAWPRWNPGVEAVETDGPFEPGTTISMTVPGDDERIVLLLTRVVPGAEFTDEASAGGVVVTTSHRLEERAQGGTRVIYHTRITGPAAGAVGPELGPQITADFPEVLAALVRLAER